MQFRDIPTPEVYKTSDDFRFFLDWFETCLTKLQYDTENVIDLLDPERCPSPLLWMLADTYGFKYDKRLPVSFNRLVLLYFMSMIYSRGSKNGVTLAAEVNLAQFNLLNYAQENEAYEDRLKDTSIPVNSVYVTPHTAEGYIDIVYFSEEDPIDACIEYVRPLGMYCFTHSGVRVDSRTKISVDARLTDINNVNLPVGPTRVGHYRRADYASLQTHHYDRGGHLIQDSRNLTYYRNSDAEGNPTPLINPGYRSLYSMQISNNEHIVKSLVPSIFSLGYGPQDVDVTYPDNYLKNSDEPMFNLRYDLAQDESITSDVYNIDKDRTESIIKPRPAVGPIMSVQGDAMVMNESMHQYSKVTGYGKDNEPVISVETVEPTDSE